MEFILKANLILLICYIFYRLLLKRHTFFNANRWFLVSGLLLSLSIPFIVIPNYIYYEATPISPIQAFDLFVLDDYGNTVEAPFSYGLWLFNIYVVGLAFFSLKLLINFKSLFKLISNSKKSKKDNYTLVQSDSNIAPFSFFRWIVLNPKQFNTEELALVLQHEKVHVRDCHTLDVMLSQLLCVLFWFNPMIWLYKRELQQNLEFIADRQVHQQSEHKQLYQTLLLKTSIPHHELVFTNTFYNSTIKKRIVMLHKQKSNRLFKFQFLFIIPILTVFLLNMNTKDVFVPIENEQIINEKDNSWTDLKVTFNKNMNTESLNEKKEFLQEYNVLMTIKKISRNENDEIIEIDIDFKAKNGVANYTVTEPDGIKPFYFEMSAENGSFGLGKLTDSGADKIDHTDLEVKINQQIASFLKQSGGTMEELLKFYKKNSLEELKEKMLEINKRMQLNDTVLMNLRVENDSIWVDSFEKGYNNRVSDSNVLINNTNQKQERYKVKYVDVKEYGLKTSQINDSIKNFMFFKELLKSNFIFNNSIKDINASVDINNLSYRIVNADTIVYLLNNKIISKSDLMSLRPIDIKKIEVIKDKKKLKKLGYSDKTGIIKITTNALPNHLQQSSQNSANYYQLKSATLVDGEDTSKNGIVQHIYKETSDEALDQQIQNFEKFGVTMSYSKLRRNKNGHITNIKVNLKNNNGQEIEDTFSEKDGAVVMEYGLSNGKLKIIKLTE